MLSEQGCEGFFANVGTMCSSTVGTVEGDATQYQHLLFSKGVSAECAQAMPAASKYCDDPAIRERKYCAHCCTAEQLMTDILEGSEMHPVPLSNLNVATTSHGSTC